MAQPASGQLSARMAISSLCHALQQCGAWNLEPEVVRQAKFSGPVAPALWRVLHDLVLLHMCDYQFPCAGQALARMWHDIQQEHLDADDEGSSAAGGLPAEGAIMVRHYLSEWGCPVALVDSLDPATASSRSLLLALAWLVHKGYLFQRVLLEMQPSLERAAMLPPLPQDTCSSSGAQQSYAAAAAQARAHVGRVMAAVQQQVQEAQAAAAAAARSDPFAPSVAQQPHVWGGVQAAAQHALMLLGKARSRLQALHSLLDCRHKLQERVRVEQAAAHPARLLSPFELYLLASPRLLEQHQEALTEATRALSEQQQLCASAQLFYTWMGSVIEEQANSEGRTWDAGSSGGLQLPAALQGSAQGMLASLQQLPECGSAMGQRLLQHLDAQLQAVARGAQPQLVYGSSIGGRAGGAAQRAAAAAAPRITAEHFVQLAEQALAPSRQEPAEQQRHSGSGSAQRTGSVQGRRAAGDAAWQLPDDIAKALTAAAQRGRQQQEALAQQEAENRLLLAASSLRHLVTGADDAAGGGGRGAGGPGRGAAEAELAAGASGSVEQETDRLLQSALGVAKALARTRAANKQALMAVVKSLPPELAVMGM